MSEALEIRGLTRRFGDVDALVEVDLQVGSGRLCVILGPSGCGKSTLLRCVAGLEEPDAGTIRIGAREVTDLPPRERDIAMVFQSYALYPHMSVRSNLAFPLRMRGAARGERDARVEQTARLLGIEELLERKPSALSGGQRQRVALGRAIVREPALFLLDEPLSNLDAELRAQMRVEIARIHREVGTAMLYVTHDQSEALSLAEKLVVMKAGRIEQVGEPREVYDHPATPFVAGFLGVPPMNLVAGEMTAGRFRAPGVDLAVPAELEGPVLLGLRPEDLTLGEEGIRGKVEMVEDLGSQRILHLRVGPDRWAVLLERDAAPRPGETVALGPAGPERVHLFVDGRRWEPAGSREEKIEP